MLSSEERISRIMEKLTTTFMPVSLAVEDDSHQHVGHSGHGGAGHFTIRITSTHFRGHSLVSQHRMIYNSLTELMGTEIHALRIMVKVPELDNLNQ